MDSSLSSKDLLNGKMIIRIEKNRIYFHDLKNLHFISWRKYLRWIIQKEKEEVVTIRFINTAKSRGKHTPTRRANRVPVFEQKTWSFPAAIMKRETLYYKKVINIRT